MSMIENEPTTSRQWFEVQTVVAYTMISGFLLLAMVWVFWHPTMSEQAEKILIMFIAAWISCMTTAVNYIFRR